MADEPEKTTIHNVYAQQFASDLAANRKEQSDIATQITGLQERLEQLKVEEGLLLKLQGTLTGSNGAEARAVADEAAAQEQREVPATDPAPAPAGSVTAAPGTVPQPRQDSRAKTAAKKSAAKGKTSAKKAAANAPAKKAAAKTATAKKAVATKTGGKSAKRVPAQAATAEESPAKETAAGKDVPAKKTAGRKGDAPTLQELILPLLARSQGHPQTAREVFDAFKAEHPERATSVQVVRNNLELLVKNDRAEKSQQQGSVMYTALTEAGAAAGAGVEAEQAPASAQAEKVAAQV
ncbi:hypothetical protein [Streptomyces sp. NBC_00557]|uniref:hypothetical protein n=1 Tax=Streptomyces sp. NBC_00557 TaxID=2975776 RepID=UPI002E818767|nr:hypothetical protein [Streptomyces sp. NBC_00557]WUC39693.1 hypothetical protein OG956_38700 [Streptomyces sp. NBC_00557]